nr:hypothetical protein [Tanacetum cinerariifolium]
MSNTLHNAIMEAGSKDRPPMLAPGNCVQWKSRIKRYIDIKPNHELIHHCLKNPPYNFTWADTKVPISECSPDTRTESKIETYKTILQDIRGQLNVEAEAVQIILTGIDNDIYSIVDACSNACECLVLTSTTTRMAKDNSSRINRSTGYENQRISNVAGARETVETKKENDAAYHREKMLLCKQEKAEIQVNAEQADWRDDTDDDELEDQELEAHYMYMAKLQEVSPDAADSGPIFDAEPLQKVSNDDHYNVFDIESEHSEQSESVPDTYPIKQDAHNVIISLFSL